MTILRYLLSVPVFLLACLATFIFGPLACIPDRATLPRWLIWMQTFDADLDNYWTHGSYANWLKTRFDQHYYDTHAWLRWYCRVLWLWRNPAYTAALYLGFDQKGLHILDDNDPDDVVWDTFTGPCRLKRTFVNARGQEGFLIRQRLYYTERWYVQIILGWKVPWDSEENAMLAFRITPFRHD